MKKNDERARELYERYGERYPANLRKHLLAAQEQERRNEAPYELASVKSRNRRRRLY